jgi:hypothetical protein
MKLNKAFSLAAVLWAEASAAEHDNHRILPLQFGEFSMFPGVVGKLVVGEDSPWNHVGSHLKSSIA